MKNVVQHLLPFGIECKITPSNTARLYYGEKNSMTDKLGFFLYGSEENLTLIAGSKKFRQAVVSLDRGFKYYSYYLQVIKSKFRTTAALKKSCLSKLPRGSEVVIREYPFAFNYDELGFSSAKAHELKIEEINSKQFTVEVIVKKRIGVEIFLIGYDKNRPFVSRLPKPVKTVLEAQKSLIPKECAGKKYIRYQNFYLVPVPKEKNYDPKFFENIKFVDPHTALYALDGEETSVCVSLGGYIKYTLSGRQHELFIAKGFVSCPHAKQIFLDKFYYVYPEQTSTNA